MRVANVAPRLISVRLHDAAPALFGCFANPSLKVLTSESFDPSTSGRGLHARLGPICRPDSEADIKVFKASNFVGLEVK